MNHIVLEAQQIEYQEKGDLQVYLVVARLENGKGDLITVVSTDEFSAGLMAKMLCKKVLFVIPLAEAMGKMKEALEQIDQKSEDD